MQLTSPGSTTTILPLASPTQAMHSPSPGFSSSQQPEAGLASSRSSSPRSLLILRLACAAFVLLILGVGATTGWRIITHNQGVIVPGELYRTAQLNGPDLREEIESHHIKSVINLRGRNPNSPWWVQEIALCRELDLAHADIPLSARHLPRPGEVADLIRNYDTLPLPILIHCNAGSDRTGFAGAVYLMERKGYAPDRAAQALSWNFGHFAVYPYFEMDEFFELYKQENPLHRSLPNWVQRDYPSVYTYEETETTWHEMLEPFESLAGIAYWRPGKTSQITGRP